MIRHISFRHASLVYALAKVAAKAHGPVIRDPAIEPKSYGFDAERGAQTCRAEPTTAKPTRYQPAPNKPAMGKRKRQWR